MVDLKDSPDPYALAHQRVKALRGPASDYRCPCGSQAAEWSLKPREQCVGNLFVVAVTSHEGKAKPMWFSDFPGDLTPRCMPCHRAADMAEHLAFEATFEPDLGPSSEEIYA